jgi:hypothetical protein
MRLPVERRSIAVFIARSFFASELAVIVAPMFVLITVILKSSKNIKFLRHVAKIHIRFWRVRNLYIDMTFKYLNTVLEFILLLIF